MPIELSDITEDERPGVDKCRDPIGVIVFDDKAWAASSPRLGIDLSGQGLPTDLPAGVKWLANLEHDEVRGLTAAQNVKDAIIRGRDWVKPSISETLSDWGASRYALPHQSKTISTLLDRVIQLCFEASRIYMGYPYSREKTFFASINSAASLATGLRYVLGPEMDRLSKSSPEGSILRSDQCPSVPRQVAGAMKFGAFVLQEMGTGDGEKSVLLRVPRFQHIIDVLGRPVPSGGKWKKAKIREAKLTSETLAELKELKLPVLICANPIQKEGLNDPFVQCWTRASQGEGSRNAFILEEVSEMMAGFNFHNPEVFVGPGWAQSSILPLVEAVITACGSVDLANMSWSAGAAAENIFYASMRLTRVADSRQLPESVWISAYDRIQSLPLVRAIEGLGAPVMSAYAGAIRLRVPDDPGMIRMLMEGGWELGLYGQISEIASLKNQGMTLSTDRTIYGGRPEHLVFSTLSQSANATALWKIDSIVEKPAEERVALFQKLLS